MQDKKKRNIKVRDIKPKKDAKGGLLPAVRPVGSGPKGATGPRPAGPKPSGIIPDY